MAGSAKDAAKAGAEGEFAGLLGEMLNGALGAFYCASSFPFFRLQRRHAVNDWQWRRAYADGEVRQQKASLIAYFQLVGRGAKFGQSFFGIFGGLNGATQKEVGMAYGQTAGVFNAVMKGAAEQRAIGRHCASCSQTRPRSAQGEDKTRAGCGSPRARGPTRLARSSRQGAQGQGARAFHRLVSRLHIRATRVG